MRSYVYRWIGLVAVVSLLAANSATAEKITVLGVPSCGQWIKERGPQNHATAYHLGWLLGYVSGANVFRIGDKDILKTIDFNSIEAWMDNYCQAHPLDSAADGARNLVIELERK